MSERAETLPELIERLRGDRSFRQLEEASGGSVHFLRWFQFAVRPVQHVSPEEVAGIARALGVEAAEVEASVAASGATVGVDEGRLAMVDRVAALDGAEGLAVRVLMACGWSVRAATGDPAGPVTLTSPTGRVSGPPVAFADALRRMGLETAGLAGPEADWD